MSRIIYFITFFVYSGFYALLAILISLNIDDGTRFITVPLRAITTILMLVVIVNSLKTINRFKAQNTILLFIIFWIFYSIKVLLNDETDLSKKSYEYIFYALNFCVLPTLMYSLIEFKKHKRNILNALLFSGFLLGVVSLYLYGDILRMGLGRIEYIKYENPDRETLSPINLSYAGALTIMLCLYQLFYNSIANSFIYKSYLYLNLSLSLIIFFLGASRGSVVALLFSILIFLIYSRGEKRKKMLAIFIIGIPILFLSALKVGSAVFERTTDTINERSFGERGKLYSNAWQEFLNNPIIGGRIEIDGIKPHNFILETLMSTGIVGFLLLTIILFIAYTRVFKISFKNENYIWVFIILIQGSILYSFSGALYTSQLLFFSIGLIYSSFLNKNYRLFYIKSKKIKV